MALKCEDVAWAGMTLVASASGGMGRGDMGRKLCFLIVYKAPSHIHTPLYSGDNRLREGSNLPSRCMAELGCELMFAFLSRALCAVLAACPAPASAYASFLATHDEQDFFK